MLCTHTVEDIEDPALEVGDYQVHLGQQFMGFRASRAPGARGRIPIPPVAGKHKSPSVLIVLPASMLLSAAWLKQWPPALSTTCMWARESPPSSALAGQNRNRCLPLGAPPPRARAFAAYIRFIHLHQAAEHQLPLASGHGAHDLVPHGPGGLRGDARAAGPAGPRKGALGRGQKVNGEKPLLKAHPGPVENGASGDGNLIAAGGALAERPAFDGPGLLVRESAEELNPSGHR